MESRSFIGKRNKANGALFETWISNSCNLYRDEMTAFIEKTPEPFHIIEKDRNGAVKGYYEKKGQPDYKGVLSGGKGIMFEAKHTETEQIRQSAVTDTQAKSLETYYILGAICFVLVSIRFEHFYRVPWTVWKDMKSLFGHKHMDVQELAPYEIDATVNGIMFLDKIEDFHKNYGKEDE